MDGDLSEARSLAGRIPWVRELHVYAEVGSTNDIARDLGERGAPEGVVVVADAQRAGRGRAGRAWWTPPGVALAVSILVRPRRPPEAWPQLAMIAGLAAVESVEAVGCPAGLKWPNDLMVPPDPRQEAPAIAWRKAGGILVEAVPPAFAVVGIGINVNIPPEAVPPELAEVLGSIRQTLGRPVPRPAVLEGLLQAFGRLYAEWNEGASVVGRWAARLIMLGRPVRIHTPAGVWEGIAESVSEAGGLWLRLPDGGRAHFPAGDVSLRWP